MFTVYQHYAKRRKGAISVKKVANDVKIEYSCLHAA